MEPIPEDEGVLTGLLRAARAAIEADRPDLSAVQVALESLLAFLASPEGRTDENCAAVGGFFLAQDEWAHSADDLPAEYAAIIWDIEGQLQDTVSDPDTAHEFESTPEQLLARLRALGASRIEGTP